ncbi:MAG TPA: (d)CMP kinase, partial [Clostridia bacterium]|nr:(d)CMP kinase [Clostridia bacterium]
EVGQAASDVSAIPAVRRHMVALQQDYAQRLDLIMDGRDIGTHVLPEAKVKLFLTADPKERARRRHLELAAKGVSISYERVLEELLARDSQDENRAISPLRQAEGAIRIDSTNLSPVEVAEIILRHVREVYP